jgi:60 kDa SS-A/Ro ribonucleoprotein
MTAYKKNLKQAVTPQTQSNTPQSKPLPGRETEMVKNSAGGYVFQTGPFMQLRRFLIIGTEGGTYYMTEKKATEKNIKCLDECLRLDYKQTIDVIQEVSVGGLAMKQDVTIMSLAICACHTDVKVREYAYSKITTILRIPTHLFMFIDFLNTMKPAWGRMRRNYISSWYTSKTIDNLAFLMAKYQNREGWSHKDVIRSAHISAPTEDYNSLFGWAVGKPYNEKLLEGTMVDCLTKMNMATSESDVVKLIIDYRAPWEVVPTQFRNSVEVWKALLPQMGMTAMIRNLANMTRYGVFQDKNTLNLAISKLENEEALKRARVHPLNVLIGMLTYNSGKSMRGDNSWSPHRDISYHLENAFYKSFKYSPKTGKRIMYALDVSGSMSSMGLGGIDKLSPAMVSGVLTMACLQVETEAMVMGFDTGIRDFSSVVKFGNRIEDVVHNLAINGGGTDTSLPCKWAVGNNAKIDAFVVLTDNETWAGAQHTSVALKEYRTKSGIEDAKMVVVGMTATEFTIADPKDPNMLDVVGFNPELPQLIGAFIGQKEEKPIASEEDLQ